MKLLCIFLLGLAFLVDGDNGGSSEETTTRAPTTTAKVWTNCTDTRNCYYNYLLNPTEEQCADPNNANARTQCSQQCCHRYGICNGYFCGPYPNPGNDPCNPADGNLLQCILDGTKIGLCDNYCTKFGGLINIPGLKNITYVNGTGICNLAPVTTLCFCSCVFNGLGPFNPAYLPTSLPVTLPSNLG